MGRGRKRKNQSWYSIILQLLLIGGVWLFLFTGKGIVEYYVVLFILILLSPIIFIIIKIRKKKAYLNSPLSKIDTMTGVQFEEFLKVYFEKMGYKVKLTPKTNDYGADLVLKKDGKTTVVQAKRWNQKVGNKAVQEIVGAKAYYKAEAAMVVTNNFFTDNACVLAKANNVELWNRNNLIKLINNLNNND